MMMESSTYSASSATESTLSEIQSSVDIEFEEFFQCLPPHHARRLVEHEHRHMLIEVVMDLGRVPEAHFVEHHETLSDQPVTFEDLNHVVEQVGDFGKDNRAGIEGTLHRISCIRNRAGVVIGLTMRLGKPVAGPAEALEDVIRDRRSVLFLGCPGVGKTTVIRDVARVSSELGRRVVIVDSSNEIGGDGNVPHPFIGRARRLQVLQLEKQFDVMIEAVQNHRPEMIVVDEIGRRKETDACRSIGERGVQIMATAHGSLLENAMNNPEVVGLLGGIGTVVIGDAAVKKRQSDGAARKSVPERQRQPVFDVLVEMRSRDEWIVHDVEKSVDRILRGENAEVEARSRDPTTREWTVSKMGYAPGGLLHPMRELPKSDSSQNTTAMKGLPAGTSSKESSRQPTDIKTSEGSGDSNATYMAILEKLQKCMEDIVAKSKNPRKRDAQKLIDIMHSVAKERLNALIKEPRYLDKRRCLMSGDWATLTTCLRPWIIYKAAKQGKQLNTEATSRAALFIASEMSSKLGVALKE